MTYIWTVHYQVPENDKPRPGVVRKYRSTSIAFKNKMSAIEFFEQNISNQEWFDPSVCYVEGPTELR